MEVQLSRTSLGESTFVGRLAAPEGEASSIITETGSGLHVPAEDPAALADAVAGLADDKGALKALAEKSLAAAPAHSREAQARHMAQVLDLVQTGRGGEAASLEPLNPGAS